MLELGVTMFDGIWTQEADPSWFLGEHKCGVVAFLCPVKNHAHVIMIRVSETDPVSYYDGDKYKNIWKLTKEPDGRISISPSILLESCQFHCGIPTYIKVVGDRLSALDPEDVPQHTTEE